MTMQRQVDPEVAKKIDEIDLTNCRTRLMDPKLGEGWTAAKADAEIAKYRNFLKLISTGMTCCPTLDVDQVWHTHILDTESYARDCQRAFGKFIHHRPYLTDSENKKNWENTKGAYQDTFGQQYSTVNK